MEILKLSQHNKNQICLLLLYLTKQRLLILKIWMFYFIFATNDLSDCHFCKKYIMGILIGREHNKRDTK